MVSRAFKNCLLLIEKMVKHNYVNQINQEELERLISMYIGADKRTIQKYTRVCVQFELLTPHIFKKEKVAVYTINLRKADHAIHEVYGRSIRQLQLFEEKQ